MSLPLSLSPSDWLDIAGVLMVLFGVAGGFWTSRRTYRHRANPNDLMPIEFGKAQWENRRKRVENAWESVLIVGLGLELLSLPIHISGAARLNRQTEELRSTNLALSARVEELRRKNDDLEAQVQPRIINERPTARLEQYSGTQVHIICASDPECSSLGSGISFMLQASKWNMLGIHLTFQEVQSGVMVGVCSTNEHFWDSDPKSPLYPACRALVDELNTKGVVAKINNTINWFTSLRFNGVLVIIGRKPSGLESQILRQEDKLSKMQDARRTNGVFHIKAEQEANFTNAVNELALLRRKQADTILGTNATGGMFMNRGIPKLP